MGQSEREQAGIKRPDSGLKRPGPDEPVKVPVASHPPATEAPPVWHHVGHVLTG
jgi:hypothetical protein